MDLSVQNTNMPRPIEFDRSKAVNRALVLFWQKGYQATSLSDLLETTNISRSSYYAMAVIELAEAVAREMPIKP